jgi:hypothetical protein
LEQAAIDDRRGREAAEQATAGEKKGGADALAVAEARCAALEEAMADERRGREDAVRAAGEVHPTALHLAPRYTICHPRCRVYHLPSTLHLGLMVDGAGGVGFGVQGSEVGM